MTTPTSTTTQRCSAPPSVAAQIASLSALPMAEIKALRQQLFGTSTPTHNLERRIAYREYLGVKYRVVACADGQYEFRGRAYPSLSRIAREITGTRWSGPLFFGLKASSAAKAPAKEGARR